MDIITWPHLGVLVAFASLCATIWKMRRDDMAEIDRRLQSFEISLAAFKIAILEKHPTVADLADVEKRFMDANRETLEAIKHLTVRIDRLLELK